MKKQSPCCARLVARIAQEKGELRRLAFRAQHPRNRTITPATIAAQKDAVKQAEANLENHYADHAAEEMVSA